MVRRRYEITDEALEKIAHLLPQTVNVADSGKIIERF
jgi:hypothetical protein